VPATAVIAAAGSGERLGAGGPKAFVDLAGKPMLAWSLEAFDVAESIDSVVVAAPRRGEALVEEIAARANVQVSVLPGGEYRSQSVMNALEAVHTEMVVVHDAARPLVRAKLIEEIVRRLEINTDMTGVVAASPVTDTIKEASISRRVLRTPERSRLWAVQTPQAFLTEALRQAFAEHADSLASATDDAMLVERSGGDVLIHEAAAENMKITTPFDLRVAEMLLAGHPDQRLER
jgi:2-C-methyl-D-erythritol 4-phosphate cytidylyltransferase